MCAIYNSVRPYATPRVMLAILAGGLGIVTLMSLYIQFGLGAIPCQMCWWQRYVHYTVALLAMVGVAKPQWARPVVGVAFAAGLVGLGVAVWQVAAQHSWLPFPATCTSHGATAAASADDLLAAMQTVKVIPCDRENFRLFGLTLATWNTPLMVGVLGWLGGVWYVARRP